MAAAKKAAARKPAHVSDLDEADEIAERTGPDAPHDERFHHTFTIAPNTRIGDDSDPASVNAHNANKVHVLELALHRGLHPQGEASYDGQDERGDGSTDLHYSVPVRPAHLVETPAETLTPAKAIDAMGGDTTTGE